MKPLNYTVQLGDTLNGIAKRYGFSDYKAAGITSVPSGNFDMIRPGEVVTIPNYQQPVQQTTTQMRTAANENGAKLDGLLTNITGASQAQKANPSQVSVVRDVDNGDGTRTVTYSDGKTARVTSTKNNDGTETYKEMTPQDAVNYDRDTGIETAVAKNKSRVDYANTTLDSIRSMANASTNALIDSIKKTYQAKIALMEDSNKRIYAAKEQSGIRSGRAKYTSDTNADILGQEEQQGIARISELEGNMLTLIAQAEQARTDKDLDIFNQRMKDLNDADSTLQTEVQNLRKNAFDSLQEMRLKDKADSDIQKQQQDMMLDKSKRAAPALLSSLAQFSTPADQAAFIIAYADKAGIDPTVLLGDIQAASQADAKSKLDIENIKNQIANRDRSTAISQQNADTSRRNSNANLAGYGFETTPDQRAKVEAYIGKNLTKDDLAAARKDSTYFYTLLSEAEGEAL